MMSQDTEQLSETDERLLRRAIELSAQAVADGNLPFGAVFADAGGNILLAEGTTGVTDNNVLCHAETNVMHAAMSALMAEERASGTLYSSCEPCPMCAGTIYWGGVTRVVFGLGERQLYEIASAQTTTPVAGLRRLPADPGTGCPGYRGDRAVSCRGGARSARGCLGRLVSLWPAGDLAALKPARARTDASGAGANVPGSTG